MRGCDNPLEGARSLLLVALLLGGIAAPTTAASAPRVALVVGNSAYENEHPLTNPGHDADLVAGVLKRDLNFDVVTLRKDVRRRALNELIGQFLAEAKHADAAVVYYSGHGMQSNGRNYLIPVDAVIRDENAIDVEGIAAEKLTDGLTDADPRVSIVILDACRNNPFGGGKGGPKGLARMAEVSEGMLIAYATRDGAIAQDGRGANSPYALALARSLKRTDLKILDQFDAVADEVKLATGNNQRPTRYGDLKASVYLVPPASPPALPPTQPVASPKPPVLVPSPTQLPGSGGRTKAVTRLARAIDPPKGNLWVEVTGDSRGDAQTPGLAQRLADAGFHSSSYRVSGMTGAAHIVTGSFRSVDAALRLRDALQAAGFSAQLLGFTKDRGDALYGESAERYFRQIPQR